MSSEMKPTAHLQRDADGKILWTDPVGATLWMNWIEERLGRALAELAALRARLEAREDDRK